MSNTPSHYLSNNANAAIGCPLKKSTIAWARCEQYRAEYNCLCSEARERLRIKRQGQDALEAQLRRLKKITPQAPPGWTIERKTRFYVITDERGEVVHRATNQKEAEDYLQLIARIHALEEENRQLWAILREELTGDLPRIRLDVDVNLEARLSFGHDDEDDFDEFESPIAL